MKIEAEDESQKELVRLLVEKACNDKLKSLKNGIIKKVWEAEVSGNRYLIKAHYPNRILQKLKHFLFGSRAMCEYRKIIKLQERGLRSPDVVGYLQYGRMSPSFIVVSATEGTELGVLLPQMNESERNELLRRLGEYVRKMHSSGVHHGDLHPGNIFVDDGRFVLLDMPRCRFSKQVSESRGLRDVASLAFGLQTACGDEEALKPFLDGYFGNEEGLRQKVVSMVRRLKKRRMKSRSARCLKESASFCRLRYRGWRIYCRRPLKEQATLWAQMISALETPPERFLKKRNYPAPLGWFRLLFRLGELRNAWYSANRLSVLGVPTVKHLAYIRRITHSGLKEFLITERAEENLQECAHRITMNGEEERKTELISRLIPFLNTLFKNNIYHRDLKAQNILLSGELLMLGDVGALSHRPLNEWRVARMLAQLNASLPGCIPTRIRLRVFFGALKDTPFWERRRWIWSTASALSQKRKEEWVRKVRREGKIL